MSQTSYDRNFGRAFSGLMSDSGYNRVESMKNDQGADIPAGIMVAFKSEGKCDLPAVATDALAGIVVHSFARDPGIAATLAGINAIKDGASCNVLAEGACNVAVEETVSVGDPVYTRITSDGSSNTQLGKFRKDADSGKAILVRGARWVKGGTTSSPAEVYFSASAAAAQSDNVEIKFDHAQVTADTLSEEWICPANKHFVVDSVQYFNATGLANDATHFFVLKVQKGSTVAASWSTETGAEGALTAGAWSLFTNAALAARTFAPGDILKLNLDEDAGATATLPAGKVVVHGRYL